MEEIFPVPDLSGTMTTNDPTVRMDFEETVDHHQSGGGRVTFVVEQGIKITSLKQCFPWKTGEAKSKDTTVAG